jgi:hypothetical protein
MPATCANSRTHCAQCAGFYSQAQLQYPVGCDCCTTYEDCEDEYTCLSTPSGNRCRPNAEAPLGVCTTDSDCFTANLCRTIACNTTLRQCYFSNATICPQNTNETACVATQQCEAETGECVRVETVCPIPEDKCREFFSCIVVDDEAVCQYQTIIPIPPIGACRIEQCNSETGWSIVNKTCPSGRTCVEGYGCQLDCTLDSQCGGLNNTFECIQGKCVGNVCMQRTTCSSTQRCSAGSCVSAGCSGTPICGAGTIADTSVSPSCPCVCDPPTCAQVPPSGPCKYSGCSDDGTTCEDRDVVCDDHNGCTTDPLCSTLTGECPTPIADCPDTGLLCPTSEICYNRQYCGPVRTGPCKACPNTTVLNCDSAGELVTKFVCDDGDPCTADSVDPVTGGCLNARDPNCCTQNGQCLSGSCDLTLFACNPPILSCATPASANCSVFAPCTDPGYYCYNGQCRGPCNPNAACPSNDYSCVDGQCLFFGRTPALGTGSCVQTFCNSTFYDDTRCDDGDSSTADFCSDALCPNSLKNCAHCAFENIGFYVTNIVEDDCTCD